MEDDGTFIDGERSGSLGSLSTLLTLPSHKHSLNSQKFYTYSQRFESKPHLLQEKGVACIVGEISRLKFLRCEANPRKPRKFCPAKISPHMVYAYILKPGNRFTSHNGNFVKLFFF